jgi:radical SAM protein (TIGR01212 family)
MSDIQKMSKLYNNYSDFLRQKFGQRVQKISVNGGFTCPNRDGSKGRGGCTYCNNQSFLPEYCNNKLSVLEQINKGVEFFKKYEAQIYIAYFQSYTNTYGTLQELQTKYEQALSHPKVVGLSIATRPDCVDEQILDYLSFLAKKYYILIEYGVESVDNEILKQINRGHTFDTSVWAINETAKRKIAVGAHLILGLPYQDRREMLASADKISELPLNVLKLHQLQIVKNTLMAKEFEKEPEKFQLFDLEEYINLLIEFIERLNPNIALERFVSQSPYEWLIAPNWGLKNFEFVHKLEKQMREKGNFQGKKFDIQRLNG